MEEADKSTSVKGEAESSAGQWGVCKLYTQDPAQREAVPLVMQQGQGCRLFLALLREVSGCGKLPFASTSRGLERCTLGRGWCLPTRQVIPSLTDLVASGPMIVSVFSGSPQLVYDTKSLLFWTRWRCHGLCCGQRGTNKVTLDGCGTWSVCPVVTHNMPPWLTHRVMWS